MIFSEFLRTQNLKHPHSRAFPAARTAAFIINSAIGLRQILPWQRNKIFTIRVSPYDVRIDIRTV